MEAEGTQQTENTRLTKIT